MGTQATTSSGKLTSAGEGINDFTSKLNGMNGHIQNNTKDAQHFTEAIGVLGGTVG